MSYEVIKYIERFKDTQYSYNEYVKKKPKVDPDIAVDFLKEGITREILIESIGYSDEAIVKAFNTITLSPEERLMLIRKVDNKRLTLGLIKTNRLSIDERLQLLSKNLNSSFAYAFVNNVDTITDKEEEYLANCFYQNPGQALDLFRFGGANRFGKAGLLKIKQGIFKNASHSMTYIKYNPDANDREEAFQAIIKTAKGAYEFYKGGDPTKAEMKQLLEKLAFSRTYLPKIVGYYINNHDKKIMAQAIFAAGDLHQAKIMLDNCSYDYDRNIIQLLEPLAMAITLIKVGT